MRQLFLALAFLLSTISGVHANAPASTTLTPLPGNLAFSAGGISGRYLFFQDYDAAYNYQIDSVIEHSGELWWAESDPGLADEPGVHLAWTQISGAGSGSGAAITAGTADPTAGTDGDAYFQVNSANVVQSLWRNASGTWTEYPLPSGGGGTTVEANPSGTDGEDLRRLTVGSDNLKVGRVRAARGGFPTPGADCDRELAYNPGTEQFEICENSPHVQALPSGTWGFIPNRTDLLVEESRSFVSSPDLGDFVFDAGAHHFYEWTVVFQSGTTRNAWVQTIPTVALADSRSNTTYAVHFLGEQDSDDVALGHISSLATGTDYFYVAGDTIRILDLSTYVAGGTTVDHWEWRDLGAEKADADLGNLDDSLDITEQATIQEKLGVTTVDNILNLTYRINESATAADAQATYWIGNIYTAVVDMTVYSFEVETLVPSGNERTYRGALVPLTQVSATSYTADSNPVQVVIRQAGATNFGTTVQIDGTGTRRGLEVQAPSGGFHVESGAYFFLGVGISANSVDTTYVLGASGTAEQDHVHHTGFPYDIISYAAKGSNDEGSRTALSGSEFFHNTTNAIRMEIRYEAVQGSLQDGVVEQSGSTCSGNDLVLARSEGLSNVTVQDACVGSGGSAGEENVQADWTETDTANDAYIENKPNLAGKADTDLQNIDTDLTVTEQAEVRSRLAISGTVSTASPQTGDGSTASPITTAEGAIERRYLSTNVQQDLARGTRVYSGLLYEIDDDARTNDNQSTRWLCNIYQGHRDLTISGWEWSARIPVNAHFRWFKATGFLVTQHGPEDYRPTGSVPFWRVRNISSGGAYEDIVGLGRGPTNITHYGAEAPDDGMHVEENGYFAQCVWLSGIDANDRTFENPDNVTDVLYLLGAFGATEVDHVNHPDFAHNFIDFIAKGARDHEMNSTTNFWHDTSYSLTQRIHYDVLEGALGDGVLESGTCCSRG